MFKKEIIWREILYQAIEKKNRRFQQQNLAEEFNFSLSTIFNALKIPRAIGSIKRRNEVFVLENPEKLLYTWGTFRNIEKDIIYKTTVEEDVIDIEASLPQGVVLGGYSAYKKIFSDIPADYDKIYVYVSQEELNRVKSYFPNNQKNPNLFVLKSDEFLKDYGNWTTIGQTFADIWNLPEWYAHDFYKDFQDKLVQLIS